MKRKIGFFLILLINCFHVLLIIYAAVLSFGLIVAPLGEIQGEVSSTEVSKDLFKFILISSIIILVLNYFLFKKLIHSKRSVTFSFLFVFIAVIIFIPFYLSALKSFINYQNGTTQLSHFIDKESITGINIVYYGDTTIVNNLNPFLNEIGTTKYQRGIWKYQKKYKILIDRNNSVKDSIMCNGEIFGPYKGRYFYTNNNFIEKYIQENQSIDSLELN